VLQSDQHRIVILETDRNRRDYLRGIVANKWWVPIIFEKETICFDNLRQLDPDLVISGPLSLDRMCRFVNTVKMMDAGLPVLILSNDRSVKDFASLNGYGDIKVLEFNFDSAELINAIGKLILQRNTNCDTSIPDNFLIIGNSPEMLNIKRSIPQLCRLREPVLIQGEPGTGKELVARAIHHQSEQRSSPFVKIHLAELNSGQLDEVLFGAAQGGFVVNNHRFHGLCDPVKGGTLFLDEIAKVPISLQSRLLSVFENIYSNLDHTAQKVAGLKLIISSSKFLDELVQQGKFREDLYFRMNAFTINMPPLRRRTGDIPLLTDFFADSICLENSVGHIEVPVKLKDSFCRYSWPGNVKELKAIVRRTIMYGIGDSVVQKLAIQWEKPSGAIKSDQDIYALAGLTNLKKYLQNQNNLTLKKVRRVYLLRTEKKVIKKALEKTNWNRKNAAELLEISYKSLLNKIKEYQLTG